MSTRWDIASDLRRLIGSSEGVPATVMYEFIRDMRLANRSPNTIEKRVEIVVRFQRYLDGKQLLTATFEDLRRFQATFDGLAPASIDIYTRHLKAFYSWALDRGFIADDPARRLITPKLTKSRPHPTPPEDLRLIFATTTGPLRIAFVLAAFAGLRRGEICGMQRSDLNLRTPLATALIHGKGRKERIVPLLGPVVKELHAYGLPRAGYLLLRRGKPYKPDQLSFEVYQAVRRIGLETTLHSARHAFATDVGENTSDPFLIRDLLGHESVATTEIYVNTSLRDVHLRLARMATMAEELLGEPPETTFPALRKDGEA